MFAVHSNGSKNLTIMMFTRSTNRLYRVDGNLNSTTINQLSKRRKYIKSLRYINTENTQFFARKGSMKRIFTYIYVGQRKVSMKKASGSYCQGVRSSYVLERTRDQ